jgi:hypothetical protein
MGNTAVDLCLKLRANDCDVRLSTRSCPIILPRRNLLGVVTIEELAGLFVLLPPCMRDPVLQLMSQLHQTDLRAPIPHLCPRKSYRFGGTPLVDRAGFVAAIQTKQIRVHPPPSSMVPTETGTTICFIDGTSWAADFVFMCYGSRDPPTITIDTGVRTSPRYVDMSSCSSAPIPIRAMGILANTLGSSF